MKPLALLKDTNRELRLFRARTAVAVGLMFALTLLIIGRLAYLQIVSYTYFTTLSQDNRLKIVPIAPPRGLIFARDGTVVAENRASFSVTVIPENANDIRGAVNELRELLDLSDAGSERFFEQLKRVRRFEKVTLKSDLNPEEFAIFAVNQHRFPGFQIEADLARHYPLGEQLAHVVGYVGRISKTDLDRIDATNYSATNHVGKIGVERARENILHGHVGYQRVEVNAQGRVLREFDKTPPIAGQDIYLTLDTSLQAAAVVAMEDRKGAIVAIDPASGGILALVSKPSFDPNAFVHGVDRALYKSWSTSSERPLFNRALQGQYPPGSTIKPLIALAGLEHRVRTPTDRTWCPGWFSLPGDQHRYRDWRKEGHGHVDMMKSISRSCDVYYYTLAHDLGINRMQQTLGRFGFGAPTGVDIPGEASGLLPSPLWKKRARDLPWYPGETVITGIGQGFLLTTPLQLAYATSIIANRGDVIIPHLVGQIEDREGPIPVDPQIYHRPRVAIMAEDAWGEIIKGMVEVVNGARGTARASGRGARVKFAGKTGTAQVFGIAQDEELEEDEIPEHLRDHALFIAFAPVDAPEIAIAIVVENGGSGSRTAAPIARRLIDTFFTVSGRKQESSG